MCVLWDLVDLRSVIQTRINCEGRVTSSVLYRTHEGVFEDSASIKGFLSSRWCGGKWWRPMAVAGGPTQWWWRARVGLGFGGRERVKTGQKWHPCAQNLVFDDVDARLGEILLAWASWPNSNSPGRRFSSLGRATWSNFHCFAVNTISHATNIMFQIPTIKTWI